MQFPPQAVESVYKQPGLFNLVAHNPAINHHFIHGVTLGAGDVLQNLEVLIG
jgi:hypothetical protein